MGMRVDGAGGLGTGVYVGYGVEVGVAMTVAPGRTFSAGEGTGSSEHPVKRRVTSIMLKPSQPLTQLSIGAHDRYPSV